MVIYFAWAARKAVWLAIAGVISAWWIYIKQPQVAAHAKQNLKAIYNILYYKFGFDQLYQALFATGAKKVSIFCNSFGDRLLIDGLVVNGSAKIVGWFSTKVRRIQTGYLYDYAFVMIIGLLALLGIRFFSF